MKILGINGSPRIGGNTDILLDKALAGAEGRGGETEKVTLSKLRFSPCQECEDMRDDGICIVQDDMCDLYKKIEASDVIILGSPIFFGSLTAQTKMMIDRFQCLWRLKYLLNKETGYKRKKGAFISVEGSGRKDFFDNARSIVRNLFATINAEYAGELLCPGIDNKAAILNHPGCLKKATELGIKLTGG